MITARGWLVALIAVAGCTDAAQRSPSFTIDRSERTGDGIPYFLRGSLGTSGPIAQVADVDAAMASALPAIAAEIHVPLDQLVASRVTHDRIGMTHVHYDQRLNDLPVVGGELIVHIAANGTITSITNGARDASKLPSVPALASSYAAELARAGADADTSAATLVYIIAKHVPHLAWEVVVTARHQPVRDRVYVDAITGDIVGRHGTIYSIKSRTVEDLHGGSYPDAIGNATLSGNEASPPTEAIAMAAFDNTGLTWDCYHDLFQRDSYDNAGAELQSIVHLNFSGDPNNAMWDGAEMLYGDGDGTLFGETPRAFDVTAHELTHAVTGATAMLEYQDESGALNEAMSDIMSATCEAHKNGGVNANTWLVGEDIFTPNTPGDALRYMANPTLDASLYPADIGGSRDYYPERYTGQFDYGGVHLNSGLANLAFELLTAGGPHPRAKTALVNSGIGIDHAGQIFEHALTQGYFMATTTFAEARTATEQAAMDLYPNTATKTAVGMAWATVGVGTAPTDTVPPTVHITAPITGTKVPVGFEIAADATDDQGVLRVDFTIDGAVVGTSMTAPYTFTTDATLAVGTHVVGATAYDAVNQASDSVTVTLIDPTCGGTCTADESCVEGACVANPDNGSGGGCCNTGRSNPAGALVLMVGAGLVLRRRPRRR
ncbi:MAG TPA: M4 family metallopeptidase [Kofleriaceae bacterium]